MWLRISAHIVSSIPKAAKTAKSGIASAITGIMRMISSSPMMKKKPGILKRDIAYAHGMASRCTKTTVASDTTTVFQT